MARKLGTKREPSLYFKRYGKRKEQEYERRFATKKVIFVGLSKLSSGYCENISDNFHNLIYFSEMEKHKKTQKLSFHKFPSEI